MKSSHGGVRKNAGRPKNSGAHGEQTKPIRVPVSMVESVHQFVHSKGYKIPLYSSSISAGFPSPADDYADTALNLNEYAIKNPTATFFLRVKGESMKNAGINSGALLVVDRSIEPKPGRIVIAASNGELTVKRWVKRKNRYFLAPENEEFSEIEIMGDMETVIWGVATKVINDL